MKYININRLKAVFLTGIILVTMTGCQAKESTPVQDGTNVAIESPLESNEIKEENIKTEEDVVAYFENFESEINEKIDEGKLEAVKESAKNAAITGIDFIFYDKEINGYTFSELSDTAKAKILLIVNSIDNKLESHLPGYKQTIKEKYGNAYDAVTEKLDEASNTLDGYLEGKYGEEYNNFKDKASDLWDDFKGTTQEGIDSTKDTYKEGWSKVKEWYENKTGK